MDQKQYVEDYHKQHLKQIRMNLNRKTEPELIDWLDKQENVQGYIKNLIKKDIAEKSEE